MFKQTAIGLTCFLLGLAGGMVAVSNAEPVRVEALGGQCKHRLAPDSSWHYQYGGYETNMELSMKCAQLGFSFLPYEYRNLKWGYRFNYVHLGHVKADNTFPLDEKEYFRAKETGTQVNSPTARFRGQGSTKGITVGLASEYPVLGLHVGPEVGIAALYSTWHTDIAKESWTTYAAPLTGCRADDWACADGWKATIYMGLTLRYGWLSVSARRYENVHASQSEKNPLFIGPTTGPVDTLMIGLSIPL